MTDIAIDDTLKSVLETATGYSVYPAGYGLKTFPRINYQAIWESTPSSHQGGVSSHATSFQITCAAKTTGGVSAVSTVKSMHSNVRTAILNITNFPDGSVDRGRHFEVGDENDNTVYYSQHEYQISWLE